MSDSATVAPDVYVARVDPNLVTAVTAVGSALIGAGSVLGAQRTQWKRQAEAATADQRKMAVEEVLVRAPAISIVIS